MAVVAISLKMYFPRSRMLDYCRDLVQLVKEERRRSLDGGVELAVLPDFLTVPEVCRALLPEQIRVGAQDICTDDRGSFTGEVSGKDLADLGVSIAEIGHSERRRLYHEDAQLIAKKVQAAWRNDLTPLLCVGEDERCTPQEASQICLTQIHESVGSNIDAPLWVAYEPLWAIGSSEPAPSDYVREVCSTIKKELQPRHEAAVLYGGSAGPGLLPALWPTVDGLFLGRFAHDPKAFVSVMREAEALVHNLSVQE